MITLFFDTITSGHHSEYLKHLVFFIHKKKLKGSYIFIVHPSFKTTFSSESKIESENSNIKIIAVNEVDLRKINKGNMLSKSINAFKVMDSYARSLNAQTVNLLYFNIFQFALGLFQPKYKINGILFQQFYRMEKQTFRDRIKYFRKYCQTFFFARNKSIKQVFILNDHKSAEYLNEQFNTNIFKALPDPVPVLTPMKDYNVREANDISPDRKILLHLGSLGVRKGTLEILDAFSHLKSEDVSKIALLLIGKANHQLDVEIRRRINFVKQTHSNSQILYENNFISDSLMKSYFDQCDLVLIPYKNVEASSGIFGHAMAALKPVIGTNKGLLGELITKNEAGITICCAKAKYIAEGIKEYLNVLTPGLSNNLYIEEHSVESFAEIILDYKNNDKTKKPLL